MKVSGAVVLMVATGLPTKCLMDRRRLSNAKGIMMIKMIIKTSAFVGVFIIFEIFFFVGLT